VILSQIWRGIAEAIGKEKTIGGKEVSPGIECRLQ